MKKFEKRVSFLRCSLER